MHYSLSKEYVWKEVGERVVVLHLDTGRYFSLNQSGSLIWRALMDGLSVHGIVDQLIATFQVDEKTAKKDAEEMIQEFLTKGAIANA